jgi:GTP-binding protein HflX
VGFVRNLPTTLIEAFRATLEEVAEATLILHVVDVSSDQAATQIGEVFRILGEIGASSTPQVLVLNKSDRLPSDAGPAELIGARLLEAARQSTLIPSVLVSGLTGEGLMALFDLIDRVLEFDTLETVRFRIPLRDGASIALLHECGKVLSAGYHGNLCDIEADAPESLRRRLQRYLVDTASPAASDSSGPVAGNSTRPVENSVNN